MALVKVNWKPDDGQLRTFGLVGAALFFVWGFHLLWKQLIGEPIAVPLVWVWLAIFWWTYVSVWHSRLLLPFYWIVTAVTLPIGIVVSFVILAVLYFCVFTPIALVFRLIGRDSLHRRFDPEARSYWTPRRPAGDVRRYFRQF